MAPTGIVSEGGIEISAEGSMPKPTGLPELPRPPFILANSTLDQQARPSI